ncbi:MAG: DUF4445 domain-containing protein, partial [Candidatus Omnitrophica bacterium]|nr:DUF4445 domain-containing protein [Candidatus Omnitrophota bacterium]
LSILDYLKESGIEINAECGGNGKCGKCRVRIEKGKENLNELTKSEQSFSLAFNERLACQAVVAKNKEDIVVFIKESGKYEILTESLAPNRTCSPACQSFAGRGLGLKLNPSTILKDNRVVCDGETLDDYKGKIYGLAVDVGTTTLVFEIVNLQTPIKSTGQAGEIVKTIAKTNPQIAYGGDVISRIEYAIVGERKLVYRTVQEIEIKIKELQKCVIDRINESLKELDIMPYIYEAVIVGNSTMRNIFFGLDIFSLGLRPYEPVHKEPIVRTAEELGLNIFPKAKVYGASLIGGHAGADALADIIASGIYKSVQPSMLIDIGTNGEVILGNSKRLISATLAAGGAYEGANVSSGTGAIEGAIKNIKIENGKAIYETIGDKEPIGICGSGLIDLLAELLRCGIMDKSAKIKEDFKVTDKIKLTQSDIYQLVNAKASLKTDQIILLKHYGIDVKDLDKIYLSGGFGNYINVKNAIKIGLLPDAEDKIVKIGNGALAGAREMLFSKEARKTSEEIAKKIEHTKPNELEKDFNNLVADNMYFED